MHMPKHGANKGGLAGSKCERDVKTKKTKKQKTINLDFMEILENMLLSSSLKMRFGSGYEMKLE